MRGEIAHEERMERESAILERVGTAKQYLTLGCAGRTFGIDIMSVREIRRWTPSTPLPNQPFGAMGVIDIRGSIVEVYDLGSLVGGGGGETDQTARVVVVVSLDTAEAALIVDTVSDIIFASHDEVRTPPKSSVENGLVTALVSNSDRLVAILDLDRLFPSYSSDPDVHFLS